MRTPRLLATALVITTAGCLYNTRGVSTLRDSMYAHFGDVGLVQTAVIEGRLEDAREAARRIAAYPADQGLPPGAEAYMERLRDQADRVAGAETLHRAAEATAEMAAACGNCHAELDRSTPFSLASTPPPAAPSAGHMLRHLWGADRMWEGLMGPSDDLWGIGALALTDAPLGFDDAAGSEVVEALARSVHDIGSRAEEAVGPGDRAELYGRLLGTCADCHRLLGTN